MNGGSNRQYLPPMGVGQPGSNNIAAGGGGGIGGAMALRFRDPVDAARTMMGARTPAAEYPDGYLATINSRRSDRLLDSLKRNLNQRGYQRGVHKGERIDPGDYFWPDEFNPDAGLARTGAAMMGGGDDRLLYVARPAPTGTVTDRLTLLGERLPRGAESIELDPRAVNNLNRLRPVWS